MAPYSLHQVLIVVAAIRLHTYSNQEAQRDWLFEKYNSEEMIVVDSHNGDDDDETLTGFMPSYIDSELDLFQTVSLV